MSWPGIATSSEFPLLALTSVSVQIKQTRSNLVIRKLQVLVGGFWVSCFSFSSLHTAKSSHPALDKKANQCSYFPKCQTSPCASDGNGLLVPCLPNLWKISATQTGSDRRPSLRFRGNAFYSSCFWISPRLLLSYLQ